MMSCTGLGLALCLLLVVICAISETVRYRAKFLVYIVLALASTTFAIPLMLLRKRDWRNALIPAYGGRLIGRVLGVRYEIRGQENIPRDSGCVLLLNHQSAMDLCVLAELWPVAENGIVIGKRQVMLMGPFGLAAWLWGTVFIDRSKPEESREIMNGMVRHIRENKAKLYVFAEGKRHSGTTLLPFKKGGFHVAVDAQVPILPVVVSRYYFLNGKAKRFDSGSSYITILPPISTKGRTKEDLPRLIEETYEVMNKTFVESTQESLTRHMERLKTE